VPANPLSKLKQMLVPSASAQQKRIAQEVIRSPAADTLWQISGGGAPLTGTGALANIGANLGGGWAGYYRPVSDNITINPSVFKMYGSSPEEEAWAKEDMLRTLSHEAGHRADLALFNVARGKKAPGRDAPFRVPKAQGNLSPQEKMARKTVDTYYQTSPREGYAQAFAVAMELMRRTPELIATGELDRKAYAEGLAEDEAKTPGLGGIVEALLKGQPMYKNHPLQQFYKTPRK